MTRRVSQAIGVAAVAVTVGCGGAGTDGTADGAGVTALINARLIDGDGSVLADRGVMLVSGGLIQAAGADVVVPAGAETIDLTGRTVMPGLINVHGHVADTMGLESGPEFYTAANLQRQLGLYADYGVTTVISLGGDGPEGFALRDGSATPDAMFEGARLLVAGRIVTATTVDEARAQVDEVAATGPDVIKIRVDDNLGATAKMPLEVARAVIDQAAQHGLKVAAHIFYLEDAKALVESGVGLIAHSVRDQLVDDAFVDQLRSTSVCVSPTLTREVSTFIYESEPDFFADPYFLEHADTSVLDALRDPERQARVAASPSAQQYKVALELATTNAVRLADAGIPLAFGTDTGPPARFQGYYEHMELEMMQAAGVPTAVVLASATGQAADCMQLGDRGYLRTGQMADFLVLTADPLADVRNARAIESVWISGRPRR